MLRANLVKRKLAAGDDVYGLYCAIPAPALVEMIGCAGYDFVVLDCEHSLVDPQQLENLVRAAETVDLTPFVRVAEGDPAAVLRALDAGALGVVIPHVRSRSDLDAAVRAARYFPQGQRSLAGGRVPGFGALEPAEYIRLANEEVMVIPLVEDAEGVDAIDEILAGGADLVLTGPADLSQSYGVPWQTRHPQVLEALQQVHAACVRHGVPFCPVSRTTESQLGWRGRGVTAFVLGEERDLAVGALRAHLAAHRAADSPALPEAGSRPAAEAKTSSSKVRLT